MLMQSVPCEVVSTATVQAVRESPVALKSPATMNLESSMASRSNKSDNCLVNADVRKCGW